MSLQKETKILVEIGDKETQTVIMDQGDIFLGRGDCFHAGESYTDFNVRIHMYLDCQPLKSCGRSHDFTYFSTETFHHVNKFAVDMSHAREGWSVKKRKLSRNKKVVQEHCAKMRLAKKLQI